MQADATAIAPARQSHTAAIAGLWLAISVQTQRQIEGAKPACSKLAENEKCGNGVFKHVWTAHTPVVRIRIPPLLETLVTVQLADIRTVFGMCVCRLRTQWDRELREIQGSVRRNREDVKIRPISILS